METIKRINDMETKKKIMHQLLEVGEMLLSSGAEISRVEETMARMGAAYGAEKTDVFAITTSIVVTMIFKNGEMLTQTRRVIPSGGTDFTRIEELNELSRRCCARPLSAEELTREVERIKKMSPGKAYFYGGSMLAVASLTMFFGGNMLDGGVAAVAAILICLLQKRFAPLCGNNVIFNFFASWITGCLICILSMIFPVHVDKVIIGDIMLLIPGLALTNAVKNMLTGDTVSGTMRLAESVLWAGALAGGFICAVWMTGV